MISSNTSNVYHVDNANISVSLENVSTSFYSDVLVPVELYNYRDFNSIDQIFSFNPNYLEFKGIIDDVASQNVTFNYTYLSPGIIKVVGNGNFSFLFNPTTIYYLDFIPLVHYNIKTEVLLDYSELGKVTYPFQSSSYITLARGWTNLGPSNIYAPPMIVDGGAGTVSAIGYSPYNLDTIYVGSGRGGPWQANIYQGADVNGFGGVFKTTDGGKSWSSVDLGLNSTTVNAIVVNPSDPNEVVIATGGLNTEVGGGIYKTINGGESWQETFPVGGNAFAYVNGVLYAASYHAILRSTNFGSTWEILKNFSQIVTTIAVSKNGTIYVGVYQTLQNFPDVQILVSKNGGSDFSEVANFPGYYTVSQIIINPTNDSNLWALVHHGYTIYPSLYRSQNYGLNWTVVNDTLVGINFEKIPSISSTFAEAPQAISYDPINGSVIYVIGPGYIYRSTDGGNHFTLLNSHLDSPNGGQDNRIISIDPLNDDIIFVGSDQGLIVSYNYGQTWHGLNNRSSSLLYDVAENGPYIFTTAQDWPPLFSNNYGKSWYMTQDSEEGVVAVDPYNASIVIHVPPWNNPVYVSNDGGKTFFVSNVNTTELYVQARDTPDAVAFGPNMIYIYGKYGIFYSKDYGHSFNLIQGSPHDPFNGGGTLTVSPSNPNIVYASNWNGLYVSDNYGFNWTEINSIIPTGTGQIGSIAVDPFNSSVIFFDVYHWYSNDIVYVSFNGGRTYKYANISSTDIFTVPPYLNFYNYKGKPILVYVSNNGVYLTTDMGRHWQNINYNLYDHIVSSFFLSSNGSAYISTYGSGVWYDPQPFDLNFSLPKPMLTGYLPSGYFLIINNMATNASGYFITQINPGANRLTIKMPNGVVNITLNANNGKIYYYNFMIFKLYNISFTESGLPPGTRWSVTLNGTTKSSNSSSIVFNEPDGKYYYRIGSINGYSVSPSSGCVLVNESSVSENLAFTQIEYNVAFTESGLPAGAQWSVTLNGATKSSNSSTIVFQEPIGMYTYTVGSVSGYTVFLGSGTINVTGNEQIAMSFEPVLYAITFTESGLPSGTLWSVTLNGTTRSSTNSSITFMMPAGSYAYTVSAPNGYKTSQSSGSISILASSVSVPVTYSSTTIMPSHSSNSLMIAGLVIVIVIIAVVVLAFRRRK
jgi:photosystem II stability/assembly factor-like uncharacterized protein